MRAALLLSVSFVIGGLAALFDFPGIYFAGKAVLGVRGFTTALLYAAIPPLVVLGWRKYKRAKMGAVHVTDLPPNTSLERTRER